MNDSIENLLEQAKKLSPAERMALIDALYDLDAPFNPEWEAAWIKECEDRLAAYDRGEMQSYDFDEVMAEVRARFKLV